MSKLRAVDFFCSAGGVTYGLRKAGLTVLGGVDVDARCQSTYETNNPGSIFIHRDISELSNAELQSRLGIVTDDDSLVFVGCSPCQYYSLVNTDKAKSAQTRLLLEDFEGFINYFRPGYILIENVPGLDTKAGSPLAAFKCNIAKWGYHFDECVVNANHYNVPQNRRRYILMATRISSKKKISIPRGNAMNCPTVQDAISTENGFAEIPAGYYDQTDFIHTASSLSPLNTRRVQSTPQNGGTRLAWKDNPELQLQCYIGRDGDFVDVYGRMHWHLPAPTITTKFNSISNGRFAHPTQDRGISLREGATLQSFPRSYVFDSKSKATIARMIGNAVPPELARHLGVAFTNYHTYATIQSQSPCR